jgi:predicted nucleic acid-binding protein
LQRTSAPAISVVTWIEVMTGASSAAEETILRAFLANFQVLEITRDVAERAVLNRRQKRLKMPDAIILATAEAAGRVLVTRNVRDFPAGMGGVRVPYRV